MLTSAKERKAPKNENEHEHEQRAKSEESFQGEGTDQRSGEVLLLGGLTGRLLHSAANEDGHEDVAQSGVGHAVALVVGLQPAHQRQQSTDLLEAVRRYAGPQQSPVLLQSLRRIDQSCNRQKR